MKIFKLYILVFIIILIFSFLLNAQQTIIKTVNDLYDDTVWEDSVVTADSGYAMLRVYGDSTCFSDEYELIGGGGELYLTLRQDSIAGGADAGTLYMGLWRGLGYPDATGWEWKSLHTFDGSNGETVAISLVDSSWITKTYPKKIKYKWVKAADVQSGLIINQHYWLRQMKSKLPFGL